ncbi:MAG: hypothetical protein LDL41_10920 [Coleofasciculus sp. S288]|nr:hypothetical protein [Coleofasciculus sp. S288]
MPYISPRSSKKATVRLVTSIYLSVVLAIGIIVILLASERLTVGGVPLRIVMEFLGDETARNAYFQGDSTKVHDRLDEMGIEEEMKAFYRPQIRDEVKLDQHIHQILYERTGYVGKAYRVNNEGVLVLKGEKK